MIRRRYFVRLDERVVTVDVELGENGDARVFLPGEPLPRTFSVLRGGNPVVLSSEGRALELYANAGGTVTAQPGRRSFAVSERSSAARHAAAATGGDAMIRAPMPGRVLKLGVAEGDRVNAGTSVLVVEAMKMENELLAPRAGLVKRLLVKAGDTVERDAPLVELE